MNKKVLKRIGVATLFVVVAFLNVSLNGEKKSQDVKLVNLANGIEANAECVNSPSSNNGNCGISNVCFWGRGDVYNCDTTRG
ncbi:MAG: hypothetical protein PHG06_07030 [Parabacteroides sp.]|nr:hypothetical protein [Parabacteroides sp.]